ncbi:hypothetical protein N9U07_00410 [bacterium]|nr:hypothetical protein [bacterium]
MFCFRFDLLFVSALWIYGVGLGPDLFVTYISEKALMDQLAELLSVLFFEVAKPLVFISLVIWASDAPSHSYILLYVDPFRA